MGYTSRRLINYKRILNKEVLEEVELDYIMDENIKIFKNGVLLFDVNENTNKFDINSKSAYNQLSEIYKRDKALYVLFGKRYLLFDEDLRLLEKGKYGENIFNCQTKVIYKKYIYNDSIIYIDINEDEIIKSDVLPQEISSLSNDLKIVTTSTNNNEIYYKDNEDIFSKLINYKNSLPKYYINYLNEKNDTIKFEYEYYED